MTAVIKDAMNAGVRRVCRVDSALAEHVERQVSLGDQAIPVVIGEPWVESVDDRDEVALECLDGSFCWVLPVHASHCDLVFQSLCLHCSDEFLGGFMVSAVEDWFEPALGHFVAGFLKCSNKFTGFPGLDGHGTDAFNVHITQNEDALVSSA